MGSLLKLPEAYPNLCVCIFCVFTVLRIFFVVPRLARKLTDFLVPVVLGWETWSLWRVVLAGHVTCREVRLFRDRSTPFHVPRGKEAPRWPWQILSSVPRRQQHQHRVLGPSHPIEDFPSHWCPAPANTSAPWNSSDRPRTSSPGSQRGLVANSLPFHPPPTGTTFLGLIFSSTHYGWGCSGRSLWVIFVLHSGHVEEGDTPSPPVSFGFEGIAS